MHEMSIAVEIVHSVLDAVSEHRPSQIEEVEVRIGVMRQVVPEALELAFAAAAEGTPVEGARLIVKEERIVAVCRHCECLYLPEGDDYTCPDCGQADARILAGNDMVLRSIVCQTEDETAGHEVGV
jgi:hydrogenase nickel incorporation protein HypA/HybF